jgi:peptidoglycan pentaglycine glycine transferase (the first glycine)
MIDIKVCENAEQWDDAIIAAGGHPLQLWGWGEVKASGSWRVERLMAYEQGKVVGYGQLLVRPLPWPFKNMTYLPRGPVAEEADREGVLQALAAYAKKRHSAVVLTVEPDWRTMPQMEGWQPSPNPILMARTLILDLTLSEDELLSHMTKKTRQYIRKSEKTGVMIRRATSSSDIAACLAIYKETAHRAGFALHGDDYYETIFSALGEHCQVFMAEYEGRVVAFLWLAVSEQTAFELYGGMNQEGQQLRANYVLKWETIRRMKAWGVREYDMNGLLNDGVSKFKQGFASHETLLAGSYEKPLSPLYMVWAKGLPFVKSAIRLIKR